MTICANGYCDDSGGFTAGFSWHRYGNNRTKWWVLGCRPFCKDGDAVIDDFGNLVEVV